MANHEGLDGELRPCPQLGERTSRNTARLRLRGDGLGGGDVRPELLGHLRDGVVAHVQRSEAAAEALVVALLVGRLGREVGLHVAFRGGLHLILGRLVLVVVATTNESVVRGAEHHPPDDILSREYLLAVFDRELRRAFRGSGTEPDDVRVVRLTLHQEHRLAIGAGEELHSRPCRGGRGAVAVASSRELLDLHRPSDEGGDDRVAEHLEAALAAEDLVAEASDDEHLAVSVACLVPALRGVDGDVAGRTPSRVLAHQDDGHLGEEVLPRLGLTPSEL